MEAGIKAKAPVITVPLPMDFKPSARPFRDSFNASPFILSSNLAPKYPGAIATNPMDAGIKAKAPPTTSIEAISFNPAAKLVKNSFNFSPDDFASGTSDDFLAASIVLSDAPPVISFTLSFPSSVTVSVKGLVPPAVLIILPCGESLSYQSPALDWTFPTWSNPVLNESVTVVKPFLRSSRACFGSENALSKLAPTVFNVPNPDFIELQRPPIPFPAARIAPLNPPKAFAATKTAIAILPIPPGNPTTNPITLPNKAIIGAIALAIDPTISRIGASDCNTFSMAILRASWASTLFISSNRTPAALAAASSVIPLSKALWYATLASWSLVIPKALACASC